MVEQGRTARGASAELDIVERAGRAWQGMAVMVARAGQDRTEQGRAAQRRPCMVEQSKGEQHRAYIT
jgi:hypothetical protein